MRHGIDGKVIDFGRQEEVSTRLIMREVVDRLEEDAKDLGVLEEVQYIHTILDKGASANRQLATYRRVLGEGATEQEALIAVVDHLIVETKRGI